MLQVFVFHVFRHDNLANGRPNCLFFCRGSADVICQNVHLFNQWNRGKVDTFNWQIHKTHKTHPLVCYIELPIYSQFIWLVSAIELPDSVHA